MNMRQIKAGGAYVEIGIRNRIAQGAKQVEADLKRIGKRVSGVGLGMVGASAAILGPLSAATQGFASMGAEVGQLSDRTGVGVRALSELKYAAGQSGVDFEDLGGAMEELNIRLGEAVIDQSGAAADALKKLGLDASVLADMPLPERLEVLADAISGIENNAQKQFLADEIFGGDAFKVMGLLNQGAKGIKGLREEAQSLGLSMSGEQAKAAKEFNAVLEKIQSVAKGVVFQIGGALAPAMTELLDLVVQSTQGIVGFVKENQGVIQAVAAVAAGVGIAGGALVALGGTITVAGVAVGGLATLIGILASPIGIATAAVAGLGIALVKYTDVGVGAVDWLNDRFGPLVTSIRNAGGAIADALAMGDTQAAWDIAVTAMELIWLDLTDEIRDAWAGVMDYVLNIGSNMAAGLGKLFQGLSGMLQSLLEGYEKYYNKVYDGVIQLGGELTGVKTIGGTGNAFESNFGSAKSVLESAIGGIGKYGVAMEKSAQGQIEDRQKRRDENRKAREAHVEELRMRLEKSSTGSGAGEGSGKSESDSDSEKSGDRGKSDELKAIEAELAARKKEAANAMSGADEAQKRTGPSGSFSAFAAGTIGIGAVSNEQRENAKLTALNRIAKNTGKPAVARFAQ